MGNTNMTSTVRWGWGVGAKTKGDVIQHRGWGLSSVLDFQSLSFLLKKIGFRW